MKIVFLVSSLGSGGAERVASTLVNAWVDRGDEVSLVATFSGRGECFYRINDKVTLVYLADSAGKTGKSLGAYYARLIALRRLLRASHADVVISFLTNVNMWAIIGTRGLKMPVIVCERSNPLYAKVKLKMLWMLARRLLYPLAACVVVQGEDMVEPFKKLVPGVKSLVVMPNPLPPELVRPRTVKTGRKKGDGGRIISMGRLVGLKQYADLIRVFSTISCSMPHWELWIYGEGPLHMQLEKLIKELHLEQRVYLAGRSSSPWDEMAKSDIFVLTSAWEGFPNALLEAMALGVPTVAFDCPSGPRAITEDGRIGLLVPANDWKAMADALTLLVSDEALRVDLGRRASDSVCERYSLTRILAMWDDVFRRIVVGKKVAVPKRAIARQ